MVGSRKQRIGTMNLIERGETLTISRQEREGTTGIIPKGEAYQAFFV